MGRDLTTLSKVNDLGALFSGFDDAVLLLELAFVPAESFLSLSILSLLKSSSL